jgi:hypothetical protein
VLAGKAVLLPRSAASHAGKAIYRKAVLSARSRETRAPRAAYVGGGFWGCCTFHRNLFRRNAGGEV